MRNTSWNFAVSAVAGIIFLAAPGLSWAEDCIKKTDGNEVCGKIIDTTSTEYVIKVGGSVEKIPVKDIDEVKRDVKDEKPVEPGSAEKAAGEDVVAEGGGDPDIAVPDLELEPLPSILRKYEANRIIVVPFEAQTFISQTKGTQQTNSGALGVGTVLGVKTPIGTLPLALGAKTGSSTTSLDSSTVESVSTEFKWAILKGYDEITPIQLAGLANDKFYEQYLDELASWTERFNELQHKFNHGYQVVYALGLTFTSLCVLPIGIPMLIAFFHFKKKLLKWIAMKPSEPKMTFDFATSLAERYNQGLRMEFDLTEQDTQVYDTY